MTRALVVFCACLSLGSCTQRMICPAYQSAFIYDKDELRKKFSYFQQDSTPKMLSASKNKYLIAEPVSYKTRMRGLQTVQMRPVPVVVPDSLVNEDSVSMEEFSRAAQSVIDSTFITDIPQEATPPPVQDSVYVITVDREVRVLKYNGADSLDYDSIRQVFIPQTPEYYITEVRYNMEQDNYMWYMRDAIVLPDVKLAKHQQDEVKGPAKRTARNKKSKGFFRNLFKKKNRPDSTEQTAPQRQDEEFDFIETDTVARLQGASEPAGMRKGLFGRRKVKENTPAKIEAKTTDKKKEDEDDGF